MRLFNATFAFALPFVPRTVCSADSNDASVFQVGNGAPANFNDGTIKVKVNGTIHSARYSCVGQTIGAVMNSVAQAKGIKAFTAYGDGSKLYPTDASKAATSFREVEIVTKDSRGL